MSNARDFGAAGDGRTDDTDALLHTLAQGDGVLELEAGDYLISKTIKIDLAQTRRFGLIGSAGTAKIIMDGPGPAFHIKGSHEQTAQPDGFKPGVWSRERMPTIMNIEIEGLHEEASGFLLEGTMQPTFEGVLLRELVDGIRIHGRARNVLISHCHIYNNAGVGIFLDRVNLHQAIITGSHISYCLRAGIMIVGSEIRNLQITGNDIEYNFDNTPGAAPSADILIDSSADKSSVREGTIVSNTIQAKYSRGGANVRMIGHNPQVNHKAGLFTISDNLIGSQETNVHLQACRGVVVSGNVIYSGQRRNLQVEGSRNIVIGPNSFDHNPDYGEKELCTGIQLSGSNDCTLSGSIIHDCQTGEHTIKDAVPLVREGLLEILDCQRINLSGCQVLDGTPFGIFVKDSSLVSITGCSVLETRKEKKTRAAIRFQGTGSGNFVTANTLGKGKDGALLAEDSAGVKVGENLQV
jgi:hypothetical protein